MKVRAGLRSCCVVTSDERYRCWGVCGLFVGGGEGGGEGGEEGGVGFGVGKREKWRGTKATVEVRVDWLWSFCGVD